MSVDAMPHPVDREEAIFEAALEMATPEQRAAYVSKACGEDSGLRRRVTSLIEAHDQAGGFLDQPPSGFHLAAAAAGLEMPNLTEHAEARALTEKPGDRIGRYRLLQKIGEGGCGVVYMAEQETPVRRRIALKIIKVGMDTRQVIARFEAERQALAMMDHRNIARVLDAGATETGRPFFVMDLVRGIRITDYCDQNNLPTEQRLELFKQVCHAIQHAHQKGIIHRDIKPSNILVTLHDGEPVPVIIDFGIAKATEQRLTDKTLFTAFDQFIGTPVYMSPEQAEMSRLDIDTRSDIYSLGVLLYELLTGKTVFDPKTLLRSGIDEMRRTIREKEPLRPSTCLSTMLEADLTTVAKRRHSEPLRLISLLRGDLDWIVMKCLEKDRTRRYETANGLVLDVDRYLRGEPVLARPPSKLYRFQKLVRRNKVAFAAAAAVALALIIGLAVSTELFMMQREAYHRAVLAERSQSRLRQEAEKARANVEAERRHSEENARQSRLNSYAADIYSAFLALKNDNLGRAMDLLEHQVPLGQEADLRGFEWRYLWQEAQGDEQISLPHDGLVSCASFTPDGQKLVTASYDGLVRIWDLASKRVIHTLNGFNQQFGWRYVAVSPNGKWLAGVRGGKLTVWEMALPDYPIRFEEPLKTGVLAFTPDSRRLVAWGDKGLLIVDPATWQSTSLHTKLTPGSYPCLAIDYPAGKLAALAHERNQAIEIWDIEAGTPARFFTFPDLAGNAFVSLAWSREGRLAAATWSGRLLLLDGRTGEVVASTQAHAGSIFGLTFTKDAQTLVTAGHDQLIHLWSVPQLQKLATLHGHRDEIWSLAFSEDGRLCTAGKDGTAKVWSLVPKPAPLYVTNGIANEFTSDGKSFVTLPEPLTELALDFWDVENPGVRTIRTLPVSDLTNLVAIALSPDAKLLGTAKKDGTAEVWSVDAGKLLMSGRIQDPIASAMAFSDNSRTMAIGTEQGTLELWNIRANQITRLGSPGTDRITALRFFPGHQFLEARQPNRSKHVVWDLKSGTELALPINTSDPFDISPDGKTLAAPGTNYVVKLWDLPSLRERAVLKAHRWTIASLAFSPDGKVLVTGGLDAMATLWDVETGVELSRPLRGHLQGVTGLAFSPDGRALATSSTDGTVKLWHVPTGRELLTIPGASQPRFSPDGNTLQLMTEMGVRLFHVPALAEIDASRQGEVAENH